MLHFLISKVQIAFIGVRQHKFEEFYWNKTVFRERLRWKFKVLDLYLFQLFFWLFKGLKAKVVALYLFLVGFGVKNFIIREKEGNLIKIRVDLNRIGLFETDFFFLIWDWVGAVYKRLFIADEAIDILGFQIAVFQNYVFDLNAAALIEHYGFNNLQRQQIQIDISAHIESDDSNNLLWIVLVFIILKIGEEHLFNGLHYTQIKSAVLHHQLRDRN